MAVVVIPVYKKELNDFERISLTQCLSVLKGHKISFAAPESLVVEDLIRKNADATVSVERFPDEYFQSLGGYNRLMNSSIFYERFLDQQFILIHQLDAFVFRDELDYWCSAGYDYIGAPWLEGFIDDAKGRFLQIAGNGGFSLRNAESHLRVLRSKKRSRIESGKELRERFFNSRRMRRVKIAPSLILKALGVGNNTAWLKNNSNEDWFWAMAAHKIDAGFISAEFKDAIGFAFESQPKRLFLLNNERLPFGCHAWAKRSNIDFWKPIFKEYGYSI